MEEGSGTQFLIWGYLTVIAALLVWTMLLWTHNQWWTMLWFIIPVGGVIGLFFDIRRKDRKPRVKTYIDRMIAYVWSVVGSVGFVLSMFSIFVWGIPVLFMICLLMGVGTTLTGLIIRFKPLIYSGFLGMVISLAFVFVDWQVELPLFAAVFLLMMVIPGHLLNCAAQKNRTNC
jgi:hypothetical protein